MSKIRVVLIEDHDLSRESLIVALAAIARIVLKQARTISLSSSGQAQSREKVEIDPIEAEYQQILEKDPLTERELEVLELIVAGCNNAAISEQLFITIGTVKTHVRNILSKLCADDRTQAAVRALRSGLVG